MTDEMHKFKRSYHEIGNMAFKLKAKGHDLFINYSPHTQSINWYIYVNGWEDGKDCYGGRWYEDQEPMTDAGLQELRAEIGKLFLGDGNEND